MLACQLFWLPPVTAQTTCIEDLNSPLGQSYQDWDWRNNELYTFHVRYLGSGLTQTITERNPFFAPSSTPISDHPNISGQFWGPNKDFNVEDGWELLFRNFGTISEPIYTAAIGLYNRLNGKIRVFIWVPDGNLAGYNNATVTLRHRVTATTPNITNLFGLTSSPARALDLKGFGAPIVQAADSAHELNRLNEYYLGTGTWLFTEFISSYDPCVCTSQSALRIEITYLKSQQINLVGESWGTLEQIIPGGPPSKETSIFSNAWSLLNGLKGAGQRGITHHRPTAGSYILAP